MLFSQNGKLVNLLALKQQAELSDQEWQDLLDYSTQVCGTKVLISARRRSRVLILRLPPIDH
jgi:hypothetical protein